MLLLRDLMAPSWRVVREVWVGKDRWKGVCQCSGGRRCICAGADFFLRKDEVRETRKEKQRGKEGPPDPNPQPGVASRVARFTH